MSRTQRPRLSRVHSGSKRWGGPARLADVDTNDRLYPGSDAMNGLTFRGEVTNDLRDGSLERARAVERAAGRLFAVRGRPRLPSTGVQWRDGLIVTANHTVEADREVTVIAPDGRTAFYSGDWA